mgnify:CR=1 FL=1
MLTGSIHGTRRYGTEIENNVRLLRAACIETEQPGFNPSLRKFSNNMQRIKQTISYDIQAELDATYIRVYSPDNDATKTKEIQRSLNNNKIQLFKICWVNFHYIVFKKF